MVEELVPGPFLRKQNWVYLWVNSFKFYHGDIPPWGKPIEKRMPWQSDI